ncbi:exonuclease domain-containing protein [Clostridium sp.]|uniref:exonuclease domain-containing protein n=1 Tax=Clostridium sp. TaxID=1506 RepID=UPI0039961BB5
MNFVAIDFETANEKRNSPCSIGIVVVKDGKIVDRIYHLIKPKEMRFLPINIGIHGIRPRMVENELEFDKVWEKIKEYFNNSLVIAHNASFDISVLRRTLELYKIEVPSFNYICTMKLAKNFYRGLDNARLNTVSEFLGFEFNHHNALADAEACSNILLNISEELRSSDINKISESLSISIGMVDDSKYKASSVKGRALISSKRTPINNKKSFYEGLSGNVFQGEVVVFTGKLSTMTRGEAMSIIRKLGGTTGSSVTKKTTCLITNSKDLDDLMFGEMSTKFRRALYLKEQGQNIKILNENEFLNIIKK